MHNVRKTDREIKIIDANKHDTGLTVMKQGDMKIELTNGKTRDIKDINISPNVIENLLSVCHFTQTGNPVIFFNDVVYVAQKNSISRKKILPILQGYSENKLWYIDLNPTGSNPTQANLAKEQKIPVVCTSKKQ